MFLFRNPSVWFAFLETEAMCGVQERLSEIVTPKYLAEGTDSRTVPRNIYLVSMGHLACTMPRVCLQFVIVVLSDHNHLLFIINVIA